MEVSVPPERFGGDDKTPPSTPRNGDDPLPPPTTQQSTPSPPPNKQRRTVPIAVFFTVQMIIGAIVFGGLSAIFVESQRIATDNTVKELIQHSMEADRLKLWGPVDRLVTTARLVATLVNDSEETLGLRPLNKPGGMTPEEYVPLLELSRDVVSLDPLLLYSTYWVQSDFHTAPGLEPNTTTKVWDFYGSSHVCTGPIVNHSFIPACGGLDRNLTVEYYTAMKAAGVSLPWPITYEPFVQKVQTIHRSSPYSKGLWIGVDVFHDLSLQTYTLSLGLYIPLRFDPVTHLATHSTAFDMNASYIQTVIGDLATTSSSVVAFYNLHDHRMIAWNLPSDAVNYTSVKMYRLGETPDDLVNKAALSTLKEYPDECVNVLKYVSSEEGHFLAAPPDPTNGVDAHISKCPGQTVGHFSTLRKEDDDGEESSSNDNGLPFKDTSLVEVKDGDETYLVASTRISDSFGFNGLLVEAVPKNHYYGALQRSRTLGIIVAVAASVIGSLITVVHLHIILKPLKKLKSDLENAGRLAFSSTEAPEELSSYISEIDDVAKAGSKLSTTLFHLKRFIPDTLLRRRRYSQHSTPSSSRGDGAWASIASDEDDDNSSQPTELQSVSVSVSGNSGFRSVRQENAHNNVKFNVSHDENGSPPLGGENPFHPPSSDSSDPSSLSHVTVLTPKSDVHQRDDLVLLPPTMLQVLPSRNDVGQNGPSGVPPLPGSEASHQIANSGPPHRQQLASRKVTLVYVAVSYTAIDDVSTTANSTTSFLSAVTGAHIQNAGGVIEELRPESILISFNAHHSVVNHEQCGVTCALKLAEKLEKVSSLSRSSKAKSSSSPPTIRDVRIAVDTSTLLVGLFNGTGRSFRSVVGEGVNTVRQLAALCDTVAKTACGHQQADGDDEDPSNCYDLVVETPSEETKATVPLELKLKRKIHATRGHKGCEAAQHSHRHCSTDIFISERTKRSVSTTFSTSGKHREKHQQQQQGQSTGLVLVDRVQMTVEHTDLSLHDDDFETKKKQIMNKQNNKPSRSSPDQCLFVYAPPNRFGRNAFLRSSRGAAIFKTVLLALCRGEIDAAATMARELVETYRDIVADRKAAAHPEQQTLPFGSAMSASYNGDAMVGSKKPTQRYTTIRDTAVRRLLLLVEYYRLQRGTSTASSAIPHCIRSHSSSWHPLPLATTTFDEQMVSSIHNRNGRHPVVLNEVDVDAIEESTTVDPATKNGVVTTVVLGLDQTSDDEDTSLRMGDKKASMFSDAIDNALGRPLQQRKEDPEEQYSAESSVMHLSERPSEIDTTPAADVGGFLSFAPVNISFAADHKGVSSGGLDDDDEDVLELPLVLVDDDGHRWLRGPEPFASGGFSQVYQGIGDNASLIAIKVMQLSNSHNAPDIDLLKSELTIASRLRHENITPYLSWQVVGRQFVCIFMEWVPGGALTQLMKTLQPALKSLPSSPNQLSFEAGKRQIIQRIVTEALHGLHYLHSQGVVHSDIKPHNLLLGTDGTVKLADFGSALSNRTATKGKNKNTAADQQDVFVMRGTSWYMAPEVAGGETPTPASDMWSFGVTILELLTGNLPWSMDQRRGGNTGPSSPQAGPLHSPNGGGGGASEFAFICRLGRRDPTFKPTIPLDPTSDRDRSLHHLLSACLNVDPSLRPTAAALLEGDFVVSSSTNA